MPVSPAERILIAKAIKRDPEAFAQLYEQFYARVLRRVLAIVRDYADAEDVTSDAFLRAWSSIDRFQDRDITILAWFCTIAERLAVKHVKSRRPRLDVDQVPGELLITTDGTSQWDEHVADLKSALEELPLLQRVIVARHCLDGFSYGELSSALGKPVGTVRVIQYRAFKALKDILSAKRAGHVAG